MRKYYKIKNKNPAKGAIDMDAIDVRDLPEEEARLIQKLVDHLKSLHKWRLFGRDKSKSV